MRGKQKKSGLIDFLLSSKIITVDLHFAIDLHIPLQERGILEKVRQLRTPEW